MKPNVKPSCEKNLFVFLKSLAVAVYGYTMAAHLVLLWGILKLTVRVRHINCPAEFFHQSSIDCAWHENLVPYFVAAMRYPATAEKSYVWMNHPAWYMKGVHIFLGWMRVQKLALGSTGHGGRRALNELIPLIQKGSSTFLNPDGPYGPAREVKSGVVDLSLATGAPVVAIRIECHTAWRLPTWDKKRIPLPFSRVDLIYSAPWQVTAANREIIQSMIQSHLCDVCV